MNMHRFLHILLVLMIPIPLFFLEGSPPTRAQVNAAFIRLVRAMEANQTGLSNPAGLAFSPKTNAFFVLEARGQGQPPPFDTNIFKLTSYSEQIGSVRIAAELPDPINIAFDPHAGRLLLYRASANQLLAIQENQGGNLDPATLTRYDARRFGLQTPQGMTVDPASGLTFFLDTTGPRIVRIEPEPDGSFDQAVISSVNLPSAELMDVRGLAFDPTTGHLHLVSLANQKLYELTQTGQVVDSRDLTGFRVINPQGVVFAPSGDQTDDPLEMSLYLADSGLAAAHPGQGISQTQEGQYEAQPVGGIAYVQSAGQILELSFIELPAPAASSFTAPLINTTDLSTISPPSPDPSGLAYLASSNTLLMSDGEVEETVGGITHFEGANVWELTLGGSVVRTANISKVAPTVVPLTNEPTGAAWNPINGHFFITDDGLKEVFDLNPGPDRQIGTSDDTWISFDTLAGGNADPEGIAFDTWNNRLFVADGVNMEVYQYTLAGSLVDQFDVEAYGVVDPESVEYNPDTGTLYVMSSNRQNRVIIETTTSGALLQTIDISLANSIKPAGLAYAPASSGSALSSFYIVDRGIDNNTDPKIIDGKMYEMAAPSSPEPSNTPTVTATPTITPTPSDTPLPTDTPTVTATPTETQTPTNTLLPPDTPTPTNTPEPLMASVRLSLVNNATVGGVAVRDEDILDFNGTSFTLYFDGSDVGVGGVDLDAFYVVDGDTILMSFDNPVTIGVLGSVDDSDIVQFDASSLGTNTGGSFGLYFDGSAVGLDTNGEDIDAIELLPDGRLLISTSGGASVLGASGADEDLLTFTPISLGATTSGTWAIYFDGSDVGLSTSSEEDVDGVSLAANSDIYLSTRGNFSVTGVSGADEDVFVCTPASLGTVTACAYSSTLFFDGSLWGLDTSDLDAIDLP